MKVSLLILVFLFIKINGQLLQAEEFDCPTDVRLRENDCNKCFCTQDGELACTGHTCPETFGKGLENCNVGTSWTKGCNKCWCLTGVGQVCTDQTCDIINNQDVIIKK